MSFHTSKVGRGDLRHSPDAPQIQRPQLDLPATPSRLSLATARPDAPPHAHTPLRLVASKAPGAGAPSIPHLWCGVLWVLSTPDFGGVV